MLAQILRNTLRVKCTASLTDLAITSFQFSFLSQFLQKNLYASIAFKKYHSSFLSLNQRQTLYILKSCDNNSELIKATHQQSIKNKCWIFLNPNIVKWLFLQG